MTKIRPSILVFSSLVATAAAYSQALLGGFVWDDHSLIENQDIVKHLAPLSEYFLRMFWSDPLDPQNRNFYRPLTTLSYTLNYQMGHGSAVTFHITNVLLHLIACLLVYVVARQARASPHFAALAMTLFGLAPRLTESVAWISGRTDVLALIGALGAVALSRWARQQERSEWPAALCLLGGLFSKETAIVGLVVLTVWQVLDTSGKPSSIGRRMTPLWPHFTALVVYLAFRLAAGMSIPGTSARAAPDALRGTDRLITALEGIGRYAFMIVDPLQPRTQIGFLGLPTWSFVAVGIVVLTLIVVFRRQLLGAQRPAGPALLAGAALALAPTLHLIPIAISVVAADRFLYFPLALLAIWFAIALSTAAPHPSQILALGSLAFCLPLAARTHLRAAQWSNEPALWKAAIVQAPGEHALPYAALANIYLTRWRVSEARDLFQKAVAIDQQAYVHAGLHAKSPFMANAALSEQMLGNFTSAEKMYREAVDLHPEKTLYKYDLALTLARGGKFDEARATLRDLSRESAQVTLSQKLLGLIDEVQPKVLEARKLQQTSLLEGLAQEARAWDELGALAKARQLWSQVAINPSSTPAQLRDAAGFLALKGTQPQAAAAIARLRGQGDQQDLADQLTVALDERFAD